MIFTGAAFDRPPFRILDPSTAIVDAVLGIVSADNAEDVVLAHERTDVDRGNARLDATQ